MSVERDAVRIISIKQRIRSLNLERWERDVLEADMLYLEHTRCHCRQLNGACTCFTRLTPERIAAVAMNAHVPRDMVSDTLRAIDAKSELRVYYDMPPFAPDIQERLTGKRPNLPARGQHRKRGRTGYHQDFKRIARQLAGQGKSNVQIADKLHVDEKTVRNWLKH